MSLPQWTVTADTHGTEALNTRASCWQQLLWLLCLPDAGGAWLLFPCQPAGNSCCGCSAWLKSPRSCPLPGCCGPISSHPRCLDVVALSVSSSVAVCQDVMVIALAAHSASTSQASALVRFCYLCAPAACVQPAELTCLNAASKALLLVEPCL